MTQLADKVYAKNIKNMPVFTYIALIYRLNYVQDVMEHIFVHCSWDTLDFCLH